MIIAHTEFAGHTTLNAAHAVAALISRPRNPRRRGISPSDALTAQMHPVIQAGARRCCNRGVHPRAEHGTVALGKTSASWLESFKTAKRTPRNSDWIDRRQERAFDILAHGENWLGSVHIAGNAQRTSSALMKRLPAPNTAVAMNS